MSLSTIITVNRACPPMRRVNMWNRVLGFIYEQIVNFKETLRSDKCEERGSLHASSPPLVRRQYHCLFPFLFYVISLKNSILPSDSQETNKNVFFFFSFIFFLLCKADKKYKKAITTQSLLPSPPSFERWVKSKWQQWNNEPRRSRLLI